MGVHSYKELDVWKRAVDLVVGVYALCEKLPKSELYALSDQMKRAAVSIPSNIAEGQKRFTKNDTIHYCTMALGSIAELETQLVIVRKVYGISTDMLQKESEVISRMLHALIKALRAK